MLDGANPSLIAEGQDIFRKEMSEGSDAANGSHQERKNAVTTHLCTVGK